MRWKDYHKLSITHPISLEDLLLICAERPTCRNLSSFSVHCRNLTQRDTKNQRREQSTKKNDKLKNGKENKKDESILVLLAEWNAIVVGQTSKIRWIYTYSAMRWWSCFDHGTFLLDSASSWSILITKSRAPFILARTLSALLVVPNTTLNQKNRSLSRFDFLLEVQILDPLYAGGQTTNVMHSRSS